MAAIGSGRRPRVLGSGIVIFVTVGSMLPFNRLIRAVDNWVQAHPQDTLAQIGDGDYIPSHMRWARMLPQPEYRRAVEQSDIIIAHAGMGSYLTAIELGKPIVMLPRHASMKEHTTNHQLHTAQWLRNMLGVHVAMTEVELADAIEKALAQGAFDAGGFRSYAPESFLQKIRQFLVQ